jgi:ubiquinone biosynthesis monooxygenase Coq7
LLGRQGIWICTAAVEAAVHRHLQDQLWFVRDRDPELHTLILAIQDEELMHLHHAEERVSESALSRTLNAMITLATDGVIWLSTWGDSSGMARELAEARRAG